MFHLLGWNVNAGANDANVAMTAAATDPAFTARNGNYIFTEPYNVLAAAHFAVSALRVRLNVPSINAILPHHFWPVNRSVTVPSDPGWDDLRAYPLKLPVSEEVQVQESNNLAMGNEQTDFFMAIAPPSWTRTLPSGLLRVKARATATITTGSNAWGAFTAITFEAALRGGWYSVVGAYVQGAASKSFQINFPRQPQVQGRKLFPGGLAEQAIGNIPARGLADGMGVWGTFHTFEQPTVAIWANAAAAVAHEIRFDMIYHGDTPPAGSVSSAFVPQG